MSLELEAPADSQRAPSLPACLPALLLQAARMIRPVKQIASGAAEMIGGLEQNNMSIRVPDGGVGGTKGLRFTHAGACAVAAAAVAASAACQRSCLLLLGPCPHTSTSAS